MESYLIESKKGVRDTQQNDISMSDIPGGSMARTNSTFDTHIMTQQRERYFDRLGVDGGNQADASFKVESRRLSRGLSNQDLSAA